MKNVLITLYSYGVITPKEVKMKNIKIGIVGYGNLGKGVQLAVADNPDMTLKAIFTRRPDLVDSYEPKEWDGYAPMVSVEKIMDWKDEIDVLILCGGSATDLPEQVPMYAKDFNTVNSFDTHADIPKLFSTADAIACSGGKVCIMSAGWDPGDFSLHRVYGQAFLPKSKVYTFWGKGVSQGHSDAIRRIPGVKNAKQYTIPEEEALESVMAGENPQLTTRDKHWRECFVVAEDGADKAEIEKAIKTMPNYFAEYNTIVHFISEEELERDHSDMPHGGFVITSGTTGGKEGPVHKQTISYKLNLQSNPEFTGNILVACARAAYRMNNDGVMGAKTMLDIPPALLSTMEGPELLKTMM